MCNDAPHGEDLVNPAETGPMPAAADDWWRTAVIYQIYPRSFADSNGDGIGDLPGITSHLHELATLGVDAIWLSPFYPSPQRDAGYDVSDYRDVDPLFGTLADADALIARAHELGLRVIADIVPNHSSSEHAWFKEALVAPPGSPARDRYFFRDGKGPDGSEPPNNWTSIFVGPAWTREIRADGTPGQWYLHLFDTTQPDFNWESEEVRSEFDDILRFWLARGIDGFRVDVAHGLIKEEGLPDYTVDRTVDPDGRHTFATTPFMGRDGVHDVWRRWRRVVEEVGADRMLAAEAWVFPLERMAHWVRPDEMHQAFNFPFLETKWEVAAQREIIGESIRAFSAVGAPSTWVLSNHDVVRHASRLALMGENPYGYGLGPKSPGQPDAVLGLRRARAASLMMLALPGSSYVYQGEELGLPEHVHIPDSKRQDPAWFRSGGERYGRDGCRVPLPWKSTAPAYGFSDTGKSWLPQPAEWGTLARDVQAADSTSTLAMYQTALAERAERRLGSGTLRWVDMGDDVLAFDNGTVRVITNMGDEPLPLPGNVIAASESVGATIPRDVTVWVERTVPTA